MEEEAAKIDRLNDDLNACKDQLEVFRRLERKLGRFSAIRRHIEGSLIAENTSEDVTRTDLLHWGTNEADTIQDLSSYSPHILEYFQYLTNKILEYEKKVKVMRTEIDENEKYLEESVNQVETLTAEVERYEEATAAMDLLHLGYKARITELENGIRVKSDADIALQRIRECLVTYPGGLAELFKAVDYDPSSLTYFPEESQSKAKYPYSNQYEKGRRHKAMKAGDAGKRSFRSI